MKVENFLVALFGLNTVVATMGAHVSGTAPPRHTLESIYQGIHAARDSPDRGTYAPNLDGTRGPSSTQSNTESLADEIAIIESLTDWGMDTMARVATDKQAELFALFLNKVDSNSPIPAPILDAGPLVTLRWFHRYQPARFDLAGQILGVQEEATLDSSVNLTDLPDLNPQGQGLTEADTEDILYGDDETNADFLSKLGMSPDDNDDDDDNKNQPQKRWLGLVFRILGTAIRSIFRIGARAAVRAGASVLETGSRVAVRGKSGLGRVFKHIKRLPFSQLSREGKISRLTWKRKESVQKLIDTFEKEQLFFERQEKEIRIEALRTMTNEERETFYDIEFARHNARLEGAYKAKYAMTEEMDAWLPDAQRETFDAWRRAGRPDLSKPKWDGRIAMAEIGEKAGHEASIRKMVAVRAANRKELARVENEVQHWEAWDKLKAEQNAAKYARKLARTDQKRIQLAKARTQREFYARLEQRLRTMSDDEWAADTLGPEMRRFMHTHDSGGADVERKFFDAYNAYGENRLQEIFKGLKQDVPGKPIDPPEPPPNSPNLSPSQMSDAELNSLDDYYMSGGVQRSGDAPTARLRRKSGCSTCKSRVFAEGMQ